MTTALVQRPEQASRRTTPTVFYPQALVEVTVFLEDLRDDPTLTYGRATGAVRRLQNMVTVAVRPLSARVVRNSYKKPDSFSVSIDAKALPLSPKQFRTCSVALFLWNSPYLGAPVPVSTDGTPLLEPVIMGLADDVSATYEDGGRVLTIDGQDYTGLFQQRQWDPRRRAPAGVRLDVALTQLMTEAKQGGAMRLRVEPDSLRTGLPIVGAKAQRTNKKGTPVKDKSTWWDVMYDVAVRHGYILFVDGLDVVLTEPHVLHESRAGLLPDGDPQRPVYRFAWGRNLTRLELRRHMGKETNPIIEGSVYVQSQRRTIRARYPAKGEKAVTGIGTERDNVVLVTPPQDITSEAELARYVRAHYELIAKGEYALSFTTDDLEDSLGRDLFAMRSGDAATVDFDIFNRDELARLPDSTRARALVDAGFEPSVASYVARNFDVVDVTKGPLRVKEVTFSYEAESGLNIDAELHDYVRVPR